MVDSRMPDVYDPEYGTPLYWANEQSGELGAAVLAYHGHMAHVPEVVCSPEQLALVIDYVGYYIKAPCWMITAKESGLAENVAEIQALIDRSAQLKTADDIHAWLMDCLNVGLDPL